MEQRNVMYVMIIKLILSRVWTILNMRSTRCYEIVLIHRDRNIDVSIFCANYGQTRMEIEWKSYSILTLFIFSMYLCHHVAISFCLSLFLSLSISLSVSFSFILLHFTIYWKKERKEFINCKWTRVNERCVIQNFVSVFMDKKQCNRM